MSKGVLQLCHSDNRWLNTAHRVFQINYFQIITISSSINYYNLHYFKNITHLQILEHKYVFKNYILEFINSTTYKSMSTLRSLCKLAMI